ncbi:MAG: hypothetical protein BHV85_10005 [Blautia sp. CAG:37_48_57]|nr:MAG: hypothetical protein BHV85_10005 [Blautia sp. CAG:37_48_57]
MGKAKMGIVINHSENIFLRQTRSNSYAFGIDDQGLVRHTDGGSGEERGGDRVRLRFPGIVPYPAPEHSARSGGTAYRHAMKDADNNVPFGETLPVHYNALAGLTVEETEIRAYGKLSAEELNSYLEMTRKLTAALREETEKL